MDMQTINISRLTGREVRNIVMDRLALKSLPTLYIERTGNSVFLCGSLKPARGLR